jgi:predicted acetyltransferase
LTQVSEVLVPLSEKARFWADFQNYLSEHSAFIGNTPDRGEFAYPWFDLYWTESDRRWPFWATVNGDIAGLALVRRDGADARTEMSEFYVRPSWRRHGVGLGFARKLFSRFPGPWKLDQVLSNTAAIAFWHRVLDGYAVYTERTFVSDVQRLEQRFAIEEALS